MAEGPWRCSQCGTINEPVANSCRTCGKWPSLFDLEDSVVAEDDLDEFQRAELESARAEQATIEPEPEAFEPDVFEPEVDETFEPFEPEPEPEADERPRRRWTSAILPIAVLVYFLISFLSER